MLRNKRVIAVCMTKLHDAGRSEYVDRLHALARENECKLLIFNSFIDFYNGDALDQGAASVFSVMNFDVIDVVVVLYASFFMPEVADDIIRRARERGKPVIVIRGEREGCYCIQPDYADAYTGMLSHVIQSHGATDTFFLNGMPDNEESDKRLACYRRALEMNGLPFDESRVGYGEFWTGPARVEVQRLLRDGRRPPRAIFCANDYMAFAVCDELRRAGYQVPGDVIVTGFDGVPASEHADPQLTTCREDIGGLAALTFRVMDIALDGGSPATFLSAYQVQLAESCGCHRMSYSHYRRAATDLYTTIDDIQNHEEFVFTWLDRMLEIKDMNALYTTVQNCILGNSCVCLNSDFVASAIEAVAESDKPFTDEMVVIPSVYSREWIGKSGKCHISDMVPDASVWAQDATAAVINSVYVGGRACGYSVAITDEISPVVHKIKRVAKAVNIAFTVALNHFRQQNMNARIQRAAFTSSVTGMPNLRGAVDWFDSFSREEKNKSLTLSFSVYGLPKYRYILDNYGVEAAEEALRIVAENLRTANPADCFLAHIAEDAFAVINYYADPNAVSGVINKATSVFFSMLEGYNSRSEKDYYVEVNCGCTVVQPGWSGALESFIKFAYGEMYMNQIKSGMGAVSKARTAAQDQYNTFSLLMEKNLFRFHFQPIVSARTGEIYAYEALMRTDELIGMSPLQVLEAARQFGRLDDVERMTLFGIMERYAAEQERFGGHRVFINTIPGHFLKEPDRNNLARRYGALMGKVIFELTEQDTVSEPELNAIRRLCGVARGSGIAIDDYGTGHSNIVNLLRYSPQIIKIDRYLIEEIHKNPSKQMFVRSTVEFARLNHIKVLAEGVETPEEMRMVIDLGVDLIQGYYTGRPAPDPSPAVQPDVLREILRANPLHVRPS